MNQEEFDKKIADSLSHGSTFVETWERIGVMYRSTQDDQRNLFFSSNLLKCWMDTHSKEITDYVLSK